MNPFSSSSVKLISPSRYLSNLESPEIRVLSNCAIAFVANLASISEVPKARKNNDGYSVLSCSFCTTRFQFACISIGFETGSKACCSSPNSFPSHAKRSSKFQAKLNKGIAFLAPNSPCIPALNCCWSVNAFLGLWQELQACVLSPDNFLSKKSFLPNTTPSSVNKLSAGIIGAINLSAKRAGISKLYGIGV